MKNEALFKDVDGLQSQINKLRPFSGKNISQLKAYFKVGLTYSSNALEGNSLTESETKVVLEEGITIGGKPLADHYEAVGHGEAFEKIFEKYTEKSISEKTVKSLHNSFYNRINQIEAGEGYLLAIIPPILRAEYIRLLELAHENDEPFIQFIGESIRETQRDYLRLFK